MSGSLKHSSTDEQLAAIRARGNVLLMAGAGTGKTRTLVDRCVAWLLDPAAPGALDQVLMVTFTDAAAAEMRQRIRKTLQEHQEQEPANPRLAEQLALLDGAHIGTLHSFCFALVRQHFYELGLDPQVAVLDEPQAKLLMGETLDELLRQHYEGADQAALAVQQLIQERARGWDKPIRELIRKIHEHSQTLRDAEGWYAAQFACFEETSPKVWREHLRQGFAAWCAHWRPYLENLPAENANACRFATALTPTGHTPTLEEIANALERIADINRNDNWPKGKMTALRKPVDKFLDAAALLRGYLPGPTGTDPLAEDWGWTRLQMLRLLWLAREFGKSYTAAKRAQAALDFNDLEQLALRLLWEPATGGVTATARLWRDKFRLVFVDEYQDINEAQDAILTALGRDAAEANRFLVGDVKQSIYGFRLTDPRIFQGYAESWRHGGAGQVLPLSHNFRSHEAILECVNSLFSGLMRRELGGVEYDTEAALKFGAPEQRAALLKRNDPPECRRVELHLLLDTPAEGEETDREDEREDAPPPSARAERTNVEKEARFVAARLRALKHQPLRVWDHETQAHRPVEWRDMVVLLRSRRSKAESYAKEFARQGVPLAAVRGGFFESIEVADLLNLLRLLDNPLQDLPLLGVLRSPLVGLSLDEMARVRLAGSKGRFWTALQKWHRDHPANAPLPYATAEVKVSRFLERYQRWRELVRQHSLSSCLESVLRETLYAEWSRAQERGEQRYANVQRLLTLARQYDPLQRQGLYRFLNFVDAHAEAELEAEPAPVATENAVRLMTIHQSKGLEFPVVVVASLGTRFNLEDLGRDIVLDQDYGLCPKVKPPHAGQRYPSIVHWLSAQRRREELLGEELRLLYVATTRACDHLILTGVAKPKQATERWPSVAAIKPDKHRILASNRFLDWIGPWLPVATGTPDWLEKKSGAGPLLSWQVHDLNQTEIGPAAPETTAGNSGTMTLDEASRQALLQRLTWQYPYPAATVEPGKSSVTVLRRRFALETDEDAAAARFLPKAGFERVRPASGRLNAAEIGNAHHQFLQAFALAQAGSERGLHGEAARLVESGELTLDQAGALDFPALTAFWQSEVGLKIRSQAAAVQRELPFTTRLDAADLTRLGLLPAGKLLADEFIVVQGVADLAVIMDQEIWLLDYKTDDVRKAGWEEKIREYTPQLQIYGLALGRIYRRAVTRLWLHFLRRRATVEIAPARED